MKKIINNRKYDTETAEQIGVWSNERYDFSSVAESLYRKRTGEYFLHGVGGANSKYAESCGQNTWRGGEKIIPLSYEAARKWAEENLTADQYEREFGEIIEDDSSESIMVSMPSSTIEKARRAAARTGVSLSGYIATLINASSEASSDA